MSYLVLFTISIIFFPYSSLLLLILFSYLEPKLFFTYSSLLFRISIFFLILLSYCLFFSPIWNILFFLILFSHLELTLSSTYFSILFRISIIFSLLFSPIWNSHNFLFILLSYLELTLFSAYSSLLFRISFIYLFFCLFFSPTAYSSLLFGTHIIFCLFFSPIWNLHYFFCLFFSLTWNIIIFFFFCLFFSPIWNLHYFLLISLTYLELTLFFAYSSYVIFYLPFLLRIGTIFFLILLSYYLFFSSIWNLHYFFAYSSLLFGTYIIFFI